MEPSVRQAGEDRTGLSPVLTGKGVLVGGEGGGTVRAAPCAGDALRCRAAAGRVAPRAALLAFIVGCGRSGTHWLAEGLASNAETLTTIETEPVFGWVTQMAVDPRQEATLFPRVASEYRSTAAPGEPRCLVDKSHPALWIAERLAAEFPTSRFVGIRRSVEPTVASMLHHDGVLRWVREWDRYPVPNRFLGITSANADAYGRMTLEERCAARVIAHSR